MYVSKTVRHYVERGHKINGRSPPHPSTQSSENPSEEEAEGL